MKQSWNVTELNAFSRRLQYSMHYTHHVAVYVLGLWIQIPFDSQKVCSTPTLSQKKIFFSKLIERLSCKTNSFLKLPRFKTYGDDKVPVLDSGCYLAKRICLDSFIIAGTYVP